MPSGMGGNLAGEMGAENEHLALVLYRVETGRS